MELFPCLILLAVTGLNILVHKSHPPHQHFYTPGLLIICVSCLSRISLSGRLHNQWLDILDAFCSTARFPSRGPDSGAGPASRCFHSKQHCHHNAHFSQNPASSKHLQQLCLFIVGAINDGVAVMHQMFRVTVSLGTPKFLPMPQK